MIDLDEETIKLRDALTKSVARNPYEDVRTKHSQMLEWLDQSLDPDTGYDIVFTATLDYYASGEGRTIVFIADNAENEHQFIRKVMAKLDGHYFVIGVKIYRGIPQDDPVIDDLLTNTVKTQICTDIAIGGGVDHFFRVYYNRS